MSINNLNEEQIMKRKEIIERLEVIKENIETMIWYADNPDLVNSLKCQGKDVSAFYECWEDDPANLSDVMKCLKEDFKGKTMSDFVKMD